MSKVVASSRHLIEVMGTVVTIDLFETREDRATRRALQRAEEVLREADRTFSTYKETSPISRLRRGDVTLGELIAHVLVHEIGHHFGLSDADIHAAENKD